MPLSIPTLDARTRDAREVIDALRAKLSPAGNIVSEAGRRRTIELFGEPLTPQQVVERICEAVRSRGLEALLEYTQKLDGRDVAGDALRVSPEELRAAHLQAHPDFLATIRHIRENVRQFQQAILAQTVCVQRRAGAALISLQQRYLPLRRVGVCVPGGAAAYPSTLLMTVVPAQTAGVQDIAVVVPPTEFGAYNTDILATCRELGVSEVYRVGGAQAVAALAFGVEGLPRVDKIVGPGNLFVALAKKYVYGDVDIDSIAGPSEVVVLADASARPDFVASDLISQAEHSPGSGVLITWHAPLLEQVRGELERQLSALQRGNLAARSLSDYGALILVASPEDGARLSDLFAPEHLHISTESPERLLPLIQNAGAIFLGHFTPVALGDYAAGPSHVLPTGGTARFANGLCANDFLKRSSLMSYSPEALLNEAPHVQIMADKEGLTAHRASIDIRLESAAQARAASSPG